jgi:cytoskeletal protein CcmA (bactofilin family)/ribosomal protein S27E
MPANKQGKVLLVCPHCGHQQPEPHAAFSTICKKCGQHLRVQEVLHPARKTTGRAPRQKHVTCFECGTELLAPVSAESTMCKRCGRYVDLHDYRIASSVAKNFKTKGALVIEPKGCVFNTNTIAGDTVIRGKFHGRLTAEGSLTIYSSAEIKGSLTAARLIIPPENHFRWPETIQVGSAEIAGELAASLRVAGTVALKPTARFFGDMEAGNLVIEDGAVIVGTLRIGPKKS